MIMLSERSSSGSYRRCNKANHSIKAQSCGKSNSEYVILKKTAAARFRGLQPFLAVSYISFKNPLTAVPRR